MGTERYIAWILLGVAMHSVSCTAQNAAIPADTGGNVSRHAIASSVSLGDTNGQVQFVFLGGADASGATGGLTLRAFDEVLFGIPKPDALLAKTTPPWLDTLWLDGQAVEMIVTNSIEVTDRCSSNDWKFASIDLTPACCQGVSRFLRHLLYVQPDLLVVCDEIIPKVPATVQAGWWFSGNAVFDPVRIELHLQLPKAGLTARAFSPKGGDMRLLPPPDALGASVVPGLKFLGAGGTNKVSEYRQIMALVPHEKSARRSLAFKLLESDTAIGLRVHRDGLPTLVAFRKNTTSGEANLTGLKFSDPVAVDVFRPKRR